MTSIGERSATTVIGRAGIGWVASLFWTILLDCLITRFAVAFVLSWSYKLTS
jgi:hypothetical protein